MATKETASLAKKAQVYENRIHCLLIKGEYRTYAWLPDRVKEGDEIIIINEKWIVGEVFRR